MTPESFAERVETENRTALSRLGSSKSLYATTAGEMDVQPVLLAAATAEHHAAVTYRTWAEDEADQRAREVWNTTATEEETHYERVVAELASEHEPGGVPAIHETLRALTETHTRAGAFVGRTLAADRSKSQFTGFFVGQAEPGLASLFRDLGEDLEAQRDRGLELLGDVCQSEAAWEDAARAADDAIQAAYEEYVSALEEMGVNPKPVC
jgi:hypothetical protein